MSEILMLLKAAEDEIRDCGVSDAWPDICRLASDEIEHLRAALEEIQTDFYGRDNFYASKGYEIARKALNPDERG